ncbi:hypothetical protein [Vibrio natriegens]|nr:hypothetical protein [Vibrio natriegens]
MNAAYWIALGEKVVIIDVVPAPDDISSAVAEWQRAYHLLIHNIAKIDQS